MTRSLFIFLFSIVLVGCAASETPVKTSVSPETEAVKSAVLDYFQGQGEADEAKMNRAFAEEVAVMITANDATFKRLEMAEVIPNWASNENPIGTRENFEFLSVEIVDDRLATVLFRSTDSFYDALTLIKAGSEWQIVSKAYVRQAVPG